MRQNLRESKKLRKDPKQSENNSRISDTIRRESEIVANLRESEASLKNLKEH